MKYLLYEFLCSPNKPELRVKILNGFVVWPQAKLVFIERIIDKQMITKYYIIVISLYKRFNTYN